MSQQLFILFASVPQLPCVKNVKFTLELALSSVFFTFISS